MFSNHRMLGCCLAIPVPCLCWSFLRIAPILRLVHRQSLALRLRGVCTACYRDDVGSIACVCEWYQCWKVHVYGVKFPKVTPVIVHSKAQNPHHATPES
eukprot:2816387-Amphidinium_carterae.1